MQDRIHETPSPVTKENGAGITSGEPPGVAPRPQPRGSVHPAAGRRGDQRLAGSVDQLAGAVDELAGTNSVLAQSNAHLTGSNTILVNSNTDLLASNAALTGSNADLSSTNTDLLASNAALTGDNAELSTRNTSLTASNTGLTASNVSLTGTNLGLASDNTHLRFDNAALFSSNSELERFAHLLAHDLKEPIRGVRQLAQFIREDAAATLDQLTSDRLARIEKMCGRTLAMVDGVLSAARVGAVALAPVRCTVCEVGTDAIESMPALIIERGCDVGCEEATAECRVMVDRVQVARALGNLIMNAVKHTGDQPVTVRVGVRDAGRAGKALNPALVTVTVSDNGPGIPAGRAVLLFRMFAQPEARGGMGSAVRAPLHSGEGTGAGLVIVRTIAERHGGEAWYEPGAKGGSTFCMTLPRA